MRDPEELRWTTGSEAPRTRDDTLGWLRNDLETIVLLSDVAMQRQARLRDRLVEILDSDRGMDEASRAVGLTPETVRALIERPPQLEQRLGVSRPAAEELRSIVRADVSDTPDAP